MQSLSQWGLAPEFLVSEEEVILSGLAPGRVVEEHKQFLRVMCGDGLILAKPRGRLLEEAKSRAEFRDSSLGFRARRRFGMR